MAVQKLEKEVVSEKKIVFAAFHSAITGPGDLAGKNTVSEKTGFKGAEMSYHPTKELLIIKYHGEEVHVPFGNCKSIRWQ